MIVFSLTIPSFNQNARSISAKKLGRFSLSLFKKYTDAWIESDISAFLDYHHDDYELVNHSTGEVKKMMTLIGIKLWAGWLLQTLKNIAVFTRMMT